MNNKEEILAKSRNENKNKDLFEKEASINAGNIAACTAAILAAIFCAVQIFVGGGMNHSLISIIFSIPATGYLIKSLRMKRKSGVVIAIICAVAALIFLIAHLYELITTSTIL